MVLVLIPCCSSPMRYHSYSCSVLRKNMKSEVVSGNNFKSMYIDCYAFMYQRIIIFMAVGVSVVFKEIYPMNIILAHCCNFNLIALKRIKETFFLKASV